MWNHERPTVKEILRKKNKEEGITPSDFRLYYKVIVIKTVRTGINRQVGQRNRRERSQIKLSIRGASLVLGQGSQEALNGERRFFSKKWCADTWIFTWQELKLT